MLQCPRRGERGITLLESMIVLTIVSLLILAAVPPLMRWSSSVRLEMAAAELVSTLRYARMFAIRQQYRVAVKFFPNEPRGRVSFALFADGDGDGVRNADLRRGIDPAVTRRRQLSHLGGRIRFGFPAGLVPSTPGEPEQPLERLEDPVRFNRSDLASFSPLGQSTPGTVYLTDGRHLMAVRVYNRTGKVNVLRYDRSRRLWSGVR